MTTCLDNSDLSQLILIRNFEQMLLKLFSEGKLNGTTHTCLGQEYIPVALCALIQENDFLFSSHRGHGYYIARFQDPKGLLAEIMGKQGAICRGVGGSQHLFRDYQFLTTGVQGESLPVAVGVAHHLKRKKPGALAIPAIGDGTWGQGTVYEALNIAKLWQLPLVVIVENNQIAQSTPQAIQMAGSIQARAQAFGLDYCQIRTKDINKIRALLEPKIATVRETCEPLIIEFITDRLGPHSKGDDTREPEEINEIRQRDWLIQYKQTFPEQVQKCEKQVEQILNVILEEVENAQPTEWKAL